VTGPPVEVAKLAVGDAHVGGIGIPVDDPGDGIARYVVLPDGVAHVHKLGGGGIFKQKNTFFRCQPFEAQGALEEFGDVHNAAPETLVPASCFFRNGVPACIFKNKEGVLRLAKVAILSINAPFRRPLSTYFQSAADFTCNYGPKTANFV
jgi:hypothetical protein